MWPFSNYKGAQFHSFHLLENSSLVDSEGTELCPYCGVWNYNVVYADDGRWGCCSCGSMGGYNTKKVHGPQFFKHYTIPNPHTEFCSHCGVYNYNTVYKDDGQWYCCNCGGMGGYRKTKKKKGE